MFTLSVITMIGYGNIVPRYALILIPVVIFDHHRHHVNKWGMKATIVFTFSHSSFNLSCSHVFTLKYDRAHQDGMGKDRHNGVCSLWHPSLHPLLHEYGQGWYHHHHHHCSRQVFANIFKWVYRWVHGCIARRKAAAKYVNFYDDNDDEVFDHFYLIHGNGDL